MRRCGKIQVKWQYGAVERIWKGRGEVQAPQFGEMQAGGRSYHVTLRGPRPTRHSRHVILPSLNFQASEKIEGLELLAAKKGKHEKEA